MLDLIILCTRGWWEVPCGIGWFCLLHHPQPARELSLQDPGVLHGGQQGRKRCPGHSTYLWVLPGPGSFREMFSNICFTSFLKQIMCKCHYGGLKFSKFKSTSYWKFQWAATKMQVKHFESTQNLLSEAMKNFSNYFEPHKITTFKMVVFQEQVIQNFCQTSWVKAESLHFNHILMA